MPHLIFWFQMKFNNRKRQGLKCLSIWCSWYLEAFPFLHITIAVVVGASPPGGGGILPPPPPPPPPPLPVQHQQSVLSSERSVKTKEDGSDNPSSKSSKSLTSENQDGGGASSKESTGDNAALKPIISTYPNSSQCDGGSEKDRTQKLCEAGATAQIYSAQQQQQQQLNQQQQLMQSLDAGECEQWGDSGSEYAPYQYSGQHNDYQQKWQKQQSPSWKQSYQHSKHQPYYQQQQYQQLSPQSRYDIQRQSDQLELYHRPPTPSSSPAVKSVSHLLSLAKKKIQTGIESVSETVEANKVTSSISILASHVGFIGGNIASGLGGSALPRARSYVGENTLPGMPVAPVPGGGRGTVLGSHPPSPSRQDQNQYPRRTTLPNPGGKQSLAKTETCDPPISELYSLGGFQQVKHADQEDGKESQRHYGEMDTSDGEENEENFVHPRKAIQQQQEQQRRKYQHQRQSAMASRKAMKASGGPSQLRLFRAETHQPRNVFHRSGGRTMQSSSIPLRPRNGGSLNPPSTKRQYDHYSDYMESSIGHKVKSAFGASMPRVPKLLKRSNDMTYNDGAWSDDEGYSGGFCLGRSKGKDLDSPSTPLSGVRLQYSGNLPASVPHPVQSLLKKRETLLSDARGRKCVLIGRTQAIVNAAQLGLLLCTLHELVPIFSAEYMALSCVSLTDDGTGGSSFIHQAIVSTMRSAMDGWAPHTLAAAFLLAASNSVWIQPQLKTVYEEAASENASDAAYARLYLRLISSLPMQKSSSSSVAMIRMAKVQALKITSTSRLRFFAILSILYVLLSTVAILRPVAYSVASTLLEVVRLPAWRGKPIAWHSVLADVNHAGATLARSVYALLETELNLVKQQPLRVVSVASLLLVLLSVACFPNFEKCWEGGCAMATSEIREEDEQEDHGAIASLWSNLGASSATRLGVLGSPRGVEGALDQFVKLCPDRAAAAGVIKKQKGGRSLRHFESPSLCLHPLPRKIMYSMASLALLSVPLAINFYTLVSDASGSHILMLLKAIPENGWLSLLDLATLLLFVHIRVRNAVCDAIHAKKIQLENSLHFFFYKLADTVNEEQRLAAEFSSKADFQAMLTSSPTKGITVSDLWAAHSSRRAWAVRGSSVQCQNGEVVLVIGADGVGKTRFLTAIAERIFVPPKAARTTTYVRGSMTVAGVDVSKWDRINLQKRVGVFLNDVRTMSDLASLMSGCTLEEILEPVLPEGSCSGPKERNSVRVAMKITGLQSELLPRLPSKLSAVISVNEDEVKPSRLRPISYPLSPSDWIRVLLTKFLAQVISDNENQLSTPDIVKKCMIGSILLLDDATLQMSEASEAKFIAALRSSGAAVLLTSNRWATGRFADRVVVIDGGSVVENGTHADLMDLGPEKSLYARQWSTMASL